MNNILWLQTKCSFLATKFSCKVFSEIKKQCHIPGPLWHFLCTLNVVTPDFIQQAQMIPVLWKLIFICNMNILCSYYTWIYSALLDSSSSQFTLLLAAFSSFSSYFHEPTQLLKAANYGQTNIAFLTVIQGALCFFFKEHTHNSAFSCLWNASVAYVWLSFS
jgi:hypothetical protein